MRSPFLFILSVAVVTGCSGGSHRTGPVDGATAPAAGSSLGDSSESSAGGFGGASGPGFAPGAGGCTTGTMTHSPANPVDTDQDNTPDTVTFTFANCAVVGSNGTETLNGTVSVADGTPTVPDFDFTATHDVHIDLAGAGTHAGESATIHVTGSRSATGTAAGPTYTMMDETANDGTLTKGAEIHHVSDSKTWNVSFTPSTAWTPGTQLVGGALSIAGTWSVHVDDKGADATLTSTGLMTLQSCMTHLVAGSITATYAGTNGNSTITVTWSGCGQRAVTYTGATTGP